MSIRTDQNILQLPRGASGYVFGFNGSILPSLIGPFTGASGIADGIFGVVPKPMTGQQNYFLKGDGTWSNSGFYGTIQDEGTGLTQRGIFNLVGSGITAVDDAGNSRTNISLNSTLNAFATYNSDGFLVQTAADTLVSRDILGTSGKITVTNGDGQSGNPVITIGADIVDKTTSNTYTAGATQILLASSTNAGVRISGVAGAPSSLTNGDIWHDTTALDLYARINGASISLTRTVLDPTPVSTSTYTFTEADRNKIKRFTVTCTANIPNGLSTDWECVIYNDSGTGIITITASGTLQGAGTTIGTNQTAATLHHKGSNVHSIWGAVGSTGGITGLTAGRVPYATSSSNIADEAGFEYDSSGNILKSVNIQAGSSTNYLLMSVNAVAQTTPTDTTGLTISSSNGDASTSVNGRSMTISAGNGYSVSGNGGGGILALHSGLKRAAGSGSEGYIDTYGDFFTIKSNDYTGGRLSLPPRTGSFPSSGTALGIWAQNSSDVTTTLALYTQQAVEAIGTFTPSHKLKIIINSVEYWIQLDAV